MSYVESVFTKNVYNSENFKIVGDALNTNNGIFPSQTISGSSFLKTVLYVYQMYFVSKMPQKRNSTSTQINLVPKMEISHSHPTYFYFSTFKVLRENILKLRSI